MLCYIFAQVIVFSSNLGARSVAASETQWPAQDKCEAGQGVQPPLPQHTRKAKPAEEPGEHMDQDREHEKQPCQGPKVWARRPRAKSLENK